jgi:hypothetical protein
VKSSAHSDAPATIAHAAPAAPKDPGSVKDIMSGQRVVSDSSIRELIIELTHLEDALRAGRVGQSEHRGSGLLNPDLLPLLRRERLIVDELRRRSMRWRTAGAQPALS